MVHSTKPCRVWRAPDPLPPSFMFIAPNQARRIDEKDKRIFRRILPAQEVWMKMVKLKYDDIIRCSICGKSRRYDQMLFYFSAMNKVVLSYCPICRLLCP